MGSLNLGTGTGAGGCFFPHDFESSNLSNAGLAAPQVPPNPALALVEGGVNSFPLSIFDIAIRDNDFCSISEDDFTLAIARFESELST